MDSMMDNIKYVLNLDEDGRILSATTTQFSHAEPQVDTLPEGDIYEYRYVDGEYIHDPLPVEPTPVDEVTLLKAQVQALSDRNDFMEDCIAEMAELVYA